MSGIQPAKTWYVLARQNNLIVAVKASSVPLQGEVEKAIREGRIK